MRIARVTSEERGETDRLLTEVAKRLRAEGVPLAGIVKETEFESAYANGCDMHVRVLPDGPIIRITQDLGKGSNACRLDPSAIADAVSRVENGSLEQSGLFILNKFGPEEAANRGFCSVIGRAMSEDVPVLVGVGRASIDAFDSFAGGLAETLPADSDAIVDWCRSVVAETAASEPA